MVKLQSLIESSAARRVKDGEFFRPKKTEVCPHCHTDVPSVPAVCWGKAVAEYQMSGLETHRCPSVEKMFSITTYRPQEKTEWSHIVMAQGIPCPITEKEKKLYVESFRSGAKVVEIRNFVFDKVYPIIPYGNWERQQEKFSN